MPSASALRLQIEQLLRGRFPAALTPAPRSDVELASTGIVEIDRLLGGGLPVGAISEITGAQSSGRTSLALSFLAERTRYGQVCAWVDADDALDPESAAAGGVLLRQLLWVRCGNNGGKPNVKPWRRLDQALRATDLLLQAGGFAAIVLDLGDTDPAHGTRIPLASWYRFRQAAARTRGSLLVLGQAPYAQSSAAVVLECAPGEANVAGGTLLCGFSCQVRLARRSSTPANEPPIAGNSAAALANARKPPGRSTQVSFARVG